MDIKNLKKQQNPYPLRVKPFNEFTPIPEGANPIVRLNSMLQYLNTLGKLTSNVVADWNKVMLWVMEDGLKESVDEKVSQLIEEGKFDELITTLLDNIKEVSQEQVDLINTYKVATLDYVNQKMTGTPKIVKNTVSDLTSSYPNGSGEMALVIADGFLYRWENGAWLKTVLYQSSTFADETLTYRMQTKLGKVGYILPSHLGGIPNYDKTTGILDFKSITGAEPSIIWGNENYAIPAGTTIDLKTPIVPASSTFKLFFDVKAKTFLVVTSTSATGINENHILIATGRSSTGMLSISCPYTIDGLPPHVINENDVVNYSIISTTEPTFTVKTGGIISVTPPKIMYLLSKTGKQLAMYTDATTVTYEVGHNQMLIWNVEENKLVVQTNNMTRNTRNVVLASNYSGKMQNGYLKPWFDVSRLPYKPYTHIVFSNLVNIKITGPLVEMPNVVMYAIGFDGQTAKQYVFPSDNNRFTLAHNQILIWDWDANTVKIMGNNDARPNKYVILGYFRENIISQGELLPFVKGNYLEDGKPVTAEYRVWDIPNKHADQGLEAIREEIWVFTASLADHSNSAKIYRYDKNTFEEKTDYTLMHNLGHCATADYNARNDMLITGNGEGAVTVKGTMHFIKNPLSFVENQQAIDFYNPSDKLLSIDFFEKNEDGTIKREIGGSGLVGCWGERDNIIYIMTGQDIPHRIFRVRLGMGSDNLSNTSGDVKNITHWGTFQSGKASNEMNGTAYITQVFTGKEYGVSQGMKGHEGRIYYAVENAEVMEIELLPNGTFKTVKAFRHYENNRADGVYWEPEGCTILDGRYLLMGRRNGAPPNMNMAWSIFPLYNEQGGKGLTGQRITLPFPCNSKPIITVTPTSEKDVYLPDVNVDANGFTVLSKTGEVAPFNWICRIS